MPVPSFAPKPDFEFGYKDTKQGNVWVTQQAVRTWEYRFDGQLCGYVARFERISSDGELTKTRSQLRTRDAYAAESGVYERFGSIRNQIAVESKIMELRSCCDQDMEHRVASQMPSNGRLLAETIRS